MNIKLTTYTRIKPKILDLVKDIIFSMPGVIFLVFQVPWLELLSPNPIAGGDNPSHPVLMQSLSEAFFGHLSVVHYSYRMWGGFELFQFYFPFPYFLAALLSVVVNSNIAFKLITILGIIFLPMSFARLAKCLNMNAMSQIVASLLCLSFLYTEAHVMWGGNIFSGLAGMIANAWAFFFVVMTFGSLIRARAQRKSSLSAIIWGVLAISSHFYATLMIFEIFMLFAIDDLVLLLRKKVHLKNLFPTYTMGLLMLLIMAWWLAPLYANKAWSSEFGGDWDMNILSTFRIQEKVFFSISILAAFFFCIRRWDTSEHIRLCLLFFIISACLFCFGHLTNSTVLSNIRLWPSIYFSLYLLTIATFDRLSKISPTLVVGVLIMSLGLLSPTSQSITNAKNWMKWNYSGIATKPAGQDFFTLVSTLNKEPRGRVSFESYGYNNGVIGGIRTFEILPYLTQHDIVEGGIVNSASFAGIPYFLQCLTSETCAGWPYGLIVPQQDTARAADMMKALGIQYHISSNEQLRESFKQSDYFDVLYDGEFFTLLRLKEVAKMIEVFDSLPPALQSHRPLISLVNLPRWDDLRKTAIVFLKTDQDIAQWPDKPTNPVLFFNFLVSKWISNSRVFDRGWQQPKETTNSKINSFLFSWQKPFDLDTEIREGFDMFIADKGFDPNILYAYNMEGYSEVVAPLIRTESGIGELEITGKGYHIFNGDQELKFNSKNQVEFLPENNDGHNIGFALLRFIPVSTERYKYVSIRTDDALIRSGLPGPSQISLPNNITNVCHTKLLTEFHKMTLQTSCPGKPHLIKYNYYPKWHSNVPIFLASNGYMLLIPNSTETTLVHTRSNIDRLAILISLITVLGIIFWKRYMW